MPIGREFLFPASADLVGDWFGRGYVLLFYGLSPLGEKPLGHPGYCGYRWFAFPGVDHRRTVPCLGENLFSLRNWPKSLS